MPNSHQLANAAIIVNIGTQLGANGKQLLAAIEAALVESNLVNVDFGDRDSLGLFQQRPSQGWGSQSQVMDPYYAANAFFVGAGTNHGALQVSQSGTAGQLAQRVQRSAFPGRYDQREGDAAAILAQLGAGAPQDTGDTAGYDNFFGIPVDYGAAAPDDSSSGQIFYLNDYLPATSNPFDSQSSGISGTVLMVGGVVLAVLLLDALVNG